MRSSCRLILVVLSSLVVTGLCAGSVADDEAAAGAGRRTPWTTSRITGSPEPPPPYDVQRVFPKVKFENPVVLTGAPGSKRLFVAELTGKIFSFPQQQTVAGADLVVDLKKHIPRLHQVYGLTFDPHFVNNRICYVCYVLPADIEDGTRVSRFRVSRDDPPKLDPAGEEIVITWRSGGHNGGCLKFGPDGYLYISTGDGGPAFPPDPLKSGQDVSNLLAGVLRIDVRGATKKRPYRVPDDNPFVDLQGARPEVWAYGMRNPWKMSFDPANGDLWVGDVGWELWEMIYRVEKGGNYGWSLVEGRQPVHRERKRGPTPVLPPTIEHSHIESRSITGGFVYHGKRLPELQKAYIYGDYVTGKIWAAWSEQGRITKRMELTDSPLAIICFGVDNEGELIVVDYDGGMYQLVKQDASRVNRDFPQKLSGTGLFASVINMQPAPGVVGYRINAEPWTDGAVAERMIGLPDRTQLGIETRNNVQKGYVKGHWRFPPDGVLVKTLFMEMEAGNPASRRRVETQVLHYDVDTWRGYSYMWNDSQTDADLVEAKGAERTFTIRDGKASSRASQGIQQLNWRFPARNECILCHVTRAGSILGFHPEQLNQPDSESNSLKVLADQGLFTQPVDLQTKPMPSPHDEAAPLENRARSYLHVNCAHCHRRGGGGTAAIDVQYKFNLKKTNLLDARPTQGTFSIHRGEVLAPGDPYRSVLYYRMSKLGRGRMPYFGSEAVDGRGLQLMRQWIEQLRPRKNAKETPPSVASQRKKQRAAVDQLRNEPAPDRRKRLIEELLAATSGALMLLDSIEEGLPKTVKEEAIALALASDRLEVRDLLERFVPAEQRTRRLGTSIDSANLLALNGVSSRGRVLFFQSSALQCKSCHKIAEQGAAIGPELTQIARNKTRAELLESILQPSKKIDPKYVSYLVETARGRVHEGLLVRRDDKEVVLRSAQNKEIKIRAAEVEFMAPQQKSLMPELLLRDLTAQQAADLLAFLDSLK